MMRQTAQEATGNVASTASGSRGTKRGGGGKSANDNKRSEFATEIKQNQYQISLRAYQTDMTEAQNILRAAGISIDAQGVLVYATDNENMIGSRINVNANNISLEVTNRQDADNTLSARIDITERDITLKADTVTVEGIETNLNSLTTRVNSLIAGSATFSLVNTQAIRLAGYSLYLGPNNTIKYGSGD